MFVADARLTLAILILVGVVAADLKAFPMVNPFLAGLVLLGGCLAIIVATTTLHARHVIRQRKSR